MAQVTWYYPNTEVKLCPKSFGCSKCGCVVDKGELYTRDNHGRYCSGCKPIRVRKEGKK